RPASGWTSNPAGPAASRNRTPCPGPCSGTTCRPTLRVLVERLRASCEEGSSAARIAERLDAEGFRPPRRAECFTREMVPRLAWHLGLPRREPHGSLKGLGRDEYRPGCLARRLGISRDRVRGWIGAG